MSESLDAPGAGLPDIERRVANMMLRSGARLLSRHRVTQLMAGESERLQRICESLSDQQASRPTLIPRIRGIEDSSRSWSVFMVLQHLAIVNQGIGEIIQSFQLDHTYDREVLIQDVKPNEAAGRECVQQMRSSVDEFLSRVGQIPKFHPTKSHHHPWFGKLNGKQWMTLAAVHMRIHRKQAESIVRLLAD